MRGRKLARADTLEAINTVSAVAFKEESMKAAVDAVEKEIRSASFESAPYKETSTDIIKNGESVASKLEELLMQLQALKGNEYAKF